MVPQVLVPEEIRRSPTSATPVTRSKRQQQLRRFQNFPDRSQNTFNSDRYQTTFSSQQQPSFTQPPPSQQQQQVQPQSGLSLPGSGRSLFDQIVNRINTGHRDNARRKQQNQDPNNNDFRQTPQQQRDRGSGFSSPLTSSNFASITPPTPPAPIRVAQPQASVPATETEQRQNLGLLLFGNSRNRFQDSESERPRSLQIQREQDRRNKLAEERRLKELEEQKRIEAERQRLVEIQREEERLKKLEEERRIQELEEQKKD